MSKTGGGRGTNQYGIWGVGKESNMNNADPDVELPDTLARFTEYTNVIRELIEQYPTAPGAVQAVGEPDWEDLSTSFSAVRPKGPDRAVARFLAQGAEAIYNDAKLEGMGFTMPEIRALIGGTHVAGHTAGEQMQVEDMRDAAGYLVNRVCEGVIEPSQTISDDIHLFISKNLNIPTLAFRGEQRVRYDGPQVNLGQDERFRSLDARVLPAVLASGLSRIEKITHPVVRGATWAAFSAYQQFYFDGNKRTGRYVMNAVAMSHGYDAVLVPASAKAEYEQVVVGALRSGDLTEHIGFLLDQYSDS